jgi:hypothetical protein
MEVPTDALIYSSDFEDELAAQMAALAHAMGVRSGRAALP